jgi:sodium/proline symporter
MAEMSTSINITFFVYLAGVMAIGIYAWIQTKNASDYFLGGRSLSPGVAAISAGASDMSGWVLLGLPGFAYLSGLEAAWISVGLCTGVALNWWLSAKRLRVYSVQLEDAVTVPAYLQRRFKDPTPWLKICSATFILLFFLFYVASGLIGGGKLFVAVFDMDYQYAVIIGAVIVVLYTLFGGFLAVSWTDVFQALLMTLALVVVPIVVVTDAGGFSETVAKVEAINPEFLDMFTDNTGAPLSLIAILSSLGWGLAYFGQPHILARFMAIRSPSDVKVAAIIGVSWSVFIYLAAIAVGLAGAVYLSTPLEDSEKVFMSLVAVLFNPVIAGILLAAILAAIMSTVDSQLLVCSAALAEDLYPLVVKDQPSAERRLQVGRLAVGGLAIVAMMFAMDPNSKVLDVVSYAWGGLGAALGPVILLSLYWPRMNRYGALAGVLVGGLTVIVWAQINGGWFDLYELVPGFFFSVIAIVAVSLFTAEPEEEIAAEFDEMLATVKSC